jgi:hypothetical protein
MVRYLEKLHAYAKEYKKQEGTKGFKAAPRQEKGPANKAGQR